MWSLTSPRAIRISGPKKFRSPPKKDFFNKIRQKRSFDYIVSERQQRWRNSDTKLPARRARTLRRACRPPRDWQFGPLGIPQPARVRPLSCQCDKVGLSNFRQKKQFQWDTRCSIVDLNGLYPNAADPECRPCLVTHGACNGQYSAPLAFISFPERPYCVSDAAYGGKRIGRERTFQNRRC